MSNYRTIREISTAFDNFYLRRGYRALEPVKITSKVDKSVYLTNSATNLFKQYFGTQEWLCARQRSMRTQILGNYYDPMSETEFPSYFVSFGAFVSPDSLQRLIDDTIEFHKGIGFRSDRMRFRISEKETLLSSYANASALSGNIWQDSRDEKYDHVYGAGLRGRAIKLDYFQENIERYKNLGYFLTICRENEIIGAEYASSDQLIHMRLHEIRFGISASFMGDLIETDSFERRRLADSLVGIAHLTYEGIFPNSSDTNGRTLKKYIAAASNYASALSWGKREIIDLLMRYLDMEYGEKNMDHAEMERRLNRSIQYCLW